MIKVYSLSKGRSEMCEEIVNELDGQGVMNEFLYAYWVNACIKDNHLEKALEIVIGMKRKNVELNCGIYASLFSEATKNNNVKVGLSLCEILKQTDLTSPQLSMSIVLFALRVKKPEIVIGEIEKMKQNKWMNLIAWNCLIQAHVQMSNIKEAISVLNIMKQSNAQPNARTFTILLTACANSKQFEDGKKIHQMTKQFLNESDFPVELSTAIINFYTKCGHPLISISEFELLKNKNVATWNCLIQPHIQTNEIDKAINIITEMKDNGVEPDSATFTILISACANSKLYEKGKFVHSLMIESWKENNSIDLSPIINFYTQCGHPEIAIEECKHLKEKGQMNVVSWTCLIQAYIQLGEIKRAIQVLDEMKEVKCHPNSNTFNILITACANSGSFKEGMKIHEMVNGTLLEPSIELSTSIINFYTKCGKPEIAIKECEKLKSNKTMTTSVLNCLIQALIQMKDLRKAIATLQEMKESGAKPDNRTFTILLTACCDSGFFMGQLIYQAIKDSIPDQERDEELSTAIINFYSKSDEPAIAIEECDKLKSEKSMNIETWNCLIRAHVQKNDFMSAKQVLYEMKENGINPDCVSFIILISGCAKFELFEEAKLIHQMAIESLESTPSELSTAILNCYTKCGRPEIAINECNKMKSRMKIGEWNCLIQAFIKQDDIKKAISALCEMQENGIDPNGITFTLLLTGCANLGMYEEGKEIHQLAIKLLEVIPSELLTSIINFYTKCGHPEIGIEEWEKISHKSTMNISSWNCLIEAHIQNTKNVLENNRCNTEFGLNKAMNVFKEMKQNNVEPDVITYVKLLHGCGDYVARNVGYYLINEIILNGFDMYEEIISAMIYFYSRIEHLYEDLIHQLNKSENTPSILTFNNIMASYAQHGKIVEVNKLLLRRKWSQMILPFQ